MDTVAFKKMLSWGHASQLFAMGPTKTKTEPSTTKINIKNPNH